MKTMGINLFFSHIAEVRISEATVFDERYIDESMWCARTVTLIAHDGTKFEFGIHSNEREIPVVVEG